MKLRRVMNGQKTIKDVGSWKTGERMPRTAFPVRGAGFKEPGKYTWRIVRFSCEGESFRLLMAYRLDLQRAMFYLGKEVRSEMLVLCRYEYHAGEPGWHMPCICDDQGKACGRLVCDDKRLPHWSSFHRELALGITRAEDAYRRADRVFRLSKTPPHELEGQPWQA